jgi:hypothetical protein
MRGKKAGTKTYQRNSIAKRQKKKPASNACGLCVIHNAGALPGKVEPVFRPAMRPE